MGQPQATPRGCICVGVYSSGSTWLYNVALQLLAARVGDQNVAAIYSDTFEEDVVRSVESAINFAIKSHKPSRLLRAYFKLLAVPTFLSIRDPRDAVTSLMQRFGISFEEALYDVAESCERILRLIEEENSVLFRYEADFIDDIDTLRSISSKLCCTQDEKLLTNILATHCSSAVNDRIDIWISRGILKQGDPAFVFEPTTQWHPNHIGDKRKRKWAELLSCDQTRLTVQRTADYRQIFGYNS